jgi:archaeosine synthase alpha-subunit
VARSVEHLDGLSIVGGARVGSVSFSTPALLESSDTGDSGLTLRHVPSAAGFRHLVLSDGSGTHDLLLPILAPEVMGAPSSGVPVGESSILVHAPLLRDAASTAAGPKPELVVLGNARALWADGLAFIQALRSVREVYGGGALLWAPRVALPHRVALLAYLGVDLVDTTEGLLAASRGEYLDPTFGRFDAATARSEGLCPCPACTAHPAGPLAVHTASAYRRAISEARAAARGGRLRELVESRLPTEPSQAEMLRYADRELSPLFDERTSVLGHGSRNYVLLESQRRPEMARFRRRFLERYRPPPSKTVLLLVPCSKRKPYRQSRSHRRFAGALENLRALERVHVVSVSSPIGLVPRELEDVPPARHYDIPVTGDWMEPERDAVLAGVRHLMTHGQYRSVVVHLDPHEYSFVEPALAGPRPVRWTLTDDHTTSPEAVATLRDAVAAALEGERPVPGGPLAVVREEIREVASVQFGREVADRLFVPPLRLAGRPWFQRLTDGRADLATLREERGLFHLTVAGARRLIPAPPLAVWVDPGLSLAGDLFTPGVRSADRDIRPGDSVVLMRGEELAGVGEAVLPGSLMTELPHGLAVRVRHREHPATDTPMTEEEPAPGAGPVV